MTSIHIFSSVLRRCMVEHLRWRFKPPAEKMRTNQQKLDRLSLVTSKVQYLMYGHSPFTRLPQTLEVLPRFPALLWRCYGGLLCWEVRTVVTHWRRLGYRGRGRGFSRLWGRDITLEISKSTLVAKWLQHTPLNRSFPGLTPVVDICYRTLSLSVSP